MGVVGAVRNKINRGENEDQLDTQRNYYVDFGQSGEKGLSYRFFELKGKEGNEG